jgi:hypothetical protein
MTADLATQAKRLQYGSVMLFTFGSGTPLFLTHCGSYLPGFSQA